MRGGYVQPAEEEMVLPPWDPRARLPGARRSFSESRLQDSSLELGQAFQACRYHKIENGLRQVLYSPILRLP